MSWFRPGRRRSRRCRSSSDLTIKTWGFSHQPWGFKIQNMGIWQIYFFLISPKNVKTSGNLGAKRTLSALSWGLNHQKPWCMQDEHWILLSNSGDSIIKRWRFFQPAIEAKIDPLSLRVCPETEDMCFHQQQSFVQLIIVWFQNVCGGEIYDSLFWVYPNFGFARYIQFVAQTKLGFSYVKWTRLTNKEINHQNTMACPLEI